VNAGREEDGMAARTPEEIDQLFERELNATNLDGLLALYEPTATFTVEPGKVVAGTAAIREALAGFVSLKPTIRLSPRVLANAGDIAMVSSKWTLKGTGPDGTAVDLSGESVEIVRRQGDGTWKFIIDSPWGIA
jgi:ketosteroid isomerase-like protein